VGTSSLRRKIALQRARPDLDVVPVRGNVDTRLRKVDAGECDAIVLARAGLVRLGLEGRATQVLEPDISLPAVGQGALGIECRQDDLETQALLAHLHDPETATCVAAERGVLVALGGDCKTPLAAHATRLGASFHLQAFIAQPDGTGLRSGEIMLDWPETEAAAREIGLRLGESLLSPAGG
jgi:hydroxymethylbilane synthase